MEMVKLVALRPLSGDFGKPNPGQTFSTDSDQAEDLEARGLAERPRVKMAAPYQNKMIGTPANKSK